MAKNEFDTARLVDEHGDYLLAFALSKLKDLDLAKDLVQDTFVSAIVKLNTFEKRSKIRTWLTSILNRKIIDHWRKAETRYTDPASSFFSQDKNAGHWLENIGDQIELKTIEDQISEVETMKELEDCLETLPDKWRGIIISKYLNEKDAKEVCKDFDISSSNLWVIIHRAKLLLQ